MRTRGLVLALTIAALLRHAAPAAAICGGGPPPPPPPPPAGEVPPDSRDPLDRPPQNDGGGPPTTRGGDGGPPTGGGGGGPTTGGSGGGPVTGGPTIDRNKAAIVRDRDDWKYWWFANRTELLEFRARAVARAARTAVSERGATAPECELWRADAQRSLALAIADPEADVVAAAAVALGRSGDRGEVRTLTRLLLDGDRPLVVRTSAALGLGFLPREDDAASEAAGDALRTVARAATERPTLRASAIYALGERGGDVTVPALVDLARSGGVTWDVPSAALSALGIGRATDARPVLERLLRPPQKGRDREWMRRVYAAHGLARLGAHESVPLLLDAADDDHPDVRRAALLALGALAQSGRSPPTEGEDAPREPARQPEDPRVARGVGAIAPRGDDAVVRERLLAAVDRDRDGPCRNMALLSLGRLGGRGVGAALRRAYESGEPIQRTYAAIALGFHARREDDGAVRKLLARELEARSMVELRGALCVACGIARATEAAPELRRIAGGTGDPDLRAHAAIALGLVGDEGAAPFLMDLVRQSADPQVQGEGALALGLLGQPKAAEVLAEQVEHSTTHRAQAAAAIALGRIGGERAAAVFVRLLSDRRTDAEVREAAALGLGMLLDPREGRTYTAVGADLDWYATTDAVREILDIH